MNEKQREAYSKMIEIAAELAQRKPLDRLAHLEGNTHIGHRQFGAAYNVAHDALGEMAYRLRACIDAARAALASAPAAPEAATREFGDVRYRGIVEAVKAHEAVTDPLRPPGGEKYDDARYVEFGLTADHVSRMWARYVDQTYAPEPAIANLIRGVTSDVWRAALGAHPPEQRDADPWKLAVVEACIANCIEWDENNPAKSLAKLVEWSVKIALDPAVSSEAQALIDRGASQRDAERDALVDQLVHALEVARNGLLWYQDRYPEAVDSSDGEAMHDIDAALAAHQAKGERG